MKVREAEKITGGLSSPSKMPGYAWGIRAVLCNRGGKLRGKEGTVCSHCYAMKGRFSFSSVEAAYDRRYRLYLDHRNGSWVAAMIVDIWSKCRRIPFFRWFDSGDVQDIGMLLRVLDVCSASPHIRFWMSTRERQLVRRVDPPENLVIRVSADMVGAPPPTGFRHTSTVRHTPGLGQWEELVNQASSKDNWHCPAPLQGNECGNCRACWDPEVLNVCYRQH